MSQNGSIEIPSFSTERLQFRGHTAEDFDESALLWSDPIVTRYIGGRPSTREESWSRLLRYVGHWSVLGFGYWVVRESSTGRFVGEIGFANYQREVTPSFGTTPEAGWVLMPWAHGKGLATEGVRRALEWLERQPGYTRSVCMISPENLASIGVATKCGFRRWSTSTYHDRPALLFER